MPSERKNSILSWLSAHWWIAVIAGALCIASWNHSVRISRADYVSNLAGGDTIAIDADSPTGYESGFRKLVVPERNAASFQWIMQVQKMFESGNWRLSQVDYDNTPDGRSVRTSSLYRWWLGAIAWIDHTVSGNPIGISVERAALIADPIVQLLLLLSTAAFIAGYFNGWSAALFSVGFVAIFPLGTAFVPGQPGDSTLLLACTIWSVLPLVAGITKSMSDSKDVTIKPLRRLFFIGGVIAGIGMWIGIAGALPVLIGIVISGAITGFFHRTKSSDSDDGNSRPLPWRIWAMGGAIVTLVAWLIDRSPALFESGSWQSDFVHPLYSIAWLGCGEILEFLDRRRKPLSRLNKITLSLSGLAICGLAYTVLFHGSVVGWSIDPVAARLTRLPSDPGVSSIGEWIGQNGSRKGLLFITLIPAALLIAGIAALVRSKDSERDTKLIAIALGPTLFAMGVAFTQLGWWNQSIELALILAVVAISSNQLSEMLKWSCRGIVLFASAMGVAFVYSGLDEKSRKSVEQAELETLVERHLAQWLAQRADTPNDGALAPPNVSVSLAYFGGLRVLGTPYPENADGFAVAVRLSAASSADEARALITGREINLIVHPTWDTFLEDYARLGTEQPESSFIALLNRWLPPRWLEPVSFHLPKVPGFENESVVIFRTVEIQDNSSAIGRLVEYFIDTGRGELAARAQAALANNFSEDLVTHITASELAMVMRDRPSFEQSIDSIIRMIESGADFYLTWEFRVSMTLVLANANRIDEMKSQLERCLAEASRSSIRRLSTTSLGRFLQLANVLKMEWPDPELKEYGISLLPPSLQAGL